MGLLAVVFASFFVGGILMYFVVSRSFTELAANDLDAIEEKKAADF